MRSGTRIGSVCEPTTAILRCAPASICFCALCSRTFSRAFTADCREEPTFQSNESHTRLLVGQGVRSVTFNNDGTQFYSTSYDKLIRLWDTETGYQYPHYFLVLCSHHWLICSHSFISKLVFQASREYNDHWQGGLQVRFVLFSINHSTFSSKQISASSFVYTYLAVNFSW